MKYFLKFSVFVFVFLFLILQVFPLYGMQILCDAQNTGGNSGNKDPDYEIKLMHSDGAKCSGDDECVSRNCFKGICMKLGYCEKDSDCGYNKYCAYKKCENLKVVGFLCSKNSECKTDNCFNGACRNKGYCDNDTDCPESQSCYNNTCRLKLTGLNCSNSKECETKNCFKGVCRDKGYCDNSSDCSYNQYCLESKCKNFKSTGLACSDNIECETGKCIKKICRDKSYCDNSSDCSPEEYCRIDRCAALKPVNSACSRGIECETKNCLSGICREKDYTETPWFLILGAGVFLTLLLLVYFMFIKKEEKNKPEALKKRYEIIKKISLKEAKTAVYVARDTKKNRNVILREIPAGDQSDKFTLRNIEEEAKTLKKCNHPNIARHADSFKEGNFFYSATESGPGEEYTLGYKFESFPANDKTAKEITEKLLDALEYLNKIKIHVNLTPENIIVDEENNPKIISLSAPDKETNKKAEDEKTEIYSAGVIMLFLLTGETLQESSDIKSLLKEKGTETVLAETAGKATEKTPEKRYRNIKEMKEALMKA